MTLKGSRKKNRKYRTDKGAFLSVAVIVLILVAVLGVRCVGLYEDIQGYRATEAQLSGDIAEEEERSQELSDYEEYVGTDEYIIEMARNKLGLVFDGEILFRQSGED
ncbi:MAG: septum formation initiator family protein [Eubacterium sp.]|nr:septum formation initiator family protein [Eubacterium sp.]